MANIRTWEPILGFVNDISVSEFVLKIVLPEGAKDIQIFLPFHADRVYEHQYFTYLDSIGKTMLIIETHNVLAEFAQDVQV